ncbi:unconventional myosin-XVIIIa [Senna tora]|uniref:Unconventional myosin-XVIIIa n=1 Tax=Senna tora TaxID=362788 RepID=A0A834WJV0_9FABA|nr:unconventional myosin-XVIIIa [Senna tora]
MIEQRHHIEPDAFAEEMSSKDEKLKTFHLQLLGMELESKKLQSHVEGLIKGLILMSTIVQMWDFGSQPWRYPANLAEILNATKQQKELAYNELGSRLEAVKSAKSSLETE